MKRRLRQLEKADDNGHTAYVSELSEHVLHDFPDAVPALIHLAGALRDLARYSEALTALRRLRRFLRPEKQYLVDSQLGHLYQQKGDFRRAEFWFRKAASARPSAATYHIFLGAILGLSGRLAEAEAEHRKATRCRTGCIDEAFLNLGFILRAQRRYREARSCFERALRISPRYKEAREALQDVKLVLRMKARRSNQSMKLTAGSSAINF